MERCQKVCWPGVLIKSLDKVLCKVNTGMHSPTHTHICTPTHAHMHVIHTQTYTHVLTGMHAHTHKHTYTYAHTHTYTHAHGTHTNLHTHVHTNTRMQRDTVLLCFLFGFKSNVAVLGLKFGLSLHADMFHYVLDVCHVQLVVAVSSLRFLFSKWAKTVCKSRVF